MILAKNGGDVVRAPELKNQAALLTNHLDCALLRPQPSRPAAQRETDAVSLVLAREVRVGYGLLQAAVEESTKALECSNVEIAAELKVLQEHAIRSIQESALATIDLFEALNVAQKPAEFALRQLELARRGRETVKDRLADFFASARNIVSIIADPLNRQLHALSCAKPIQRSAADSGDSILSRLNTLTGRQKMVLVLLAEGLPNKVIAHELGISETTVKAHVGEILRKLKVYNRARAIVLLAQFDMRQFRALS